MHKKSLGLAGLLIVGFAVLMWMQQFTQNVEQRRAVTVYSRNSQSLSLLREWKDIAPGQAVAINKKAFLFPQDLQAFDGVMIASPRMSLQEKEAKTLANYVIQGGRLVLSAHDRGTHSHFHRLFKALEIQWGIRDIENFQNRQITTVAASDGDALFEPQQLYGFYSLIQFDRACAPPALDCFARRAEVGRGEVLLLLGLPLAANAMVHYAGNIDFTLALGRWAPRLLIDEYHHFYTDKTLADVFARLDFTLPLGGMIAGLLLFFCFGHSTFHERALRPVSARSYHELNVNIVRKFLREPNLARDAVAQQRQFLQRLFPEQREALDDLHQRGGQSVSRNPRALPQVLDDFACFHREHLKRRGRKGPA